MINTKVCVLAGHTGAKEYFMMEKYASQGCKIAFMNKNKELGRKIKEELESVYQVSVFFFHGDISSEEDRDLFFSAIKEMYGRTDYLICQSN